MSTNQSSKAAVVTMICPNLACRRTVSAPASMRGMTVLCAYCQTPFRVPIADSRDSKEPTSEDGKGGGRRNK